MTAQMHVQGAHPALAEPINHIGDITDDLPADVMGEILADAVQKAWRAGCDPTHCKVEVSFS